MPGRVSHNVSQCAYISSLLTASACPHLFPLLHALPNPQRPPSLPPPILLRPLFWYSWLRRRIAYQSQALMRGLADLIRPEWIRMFSPDELQMLISGSVQVGSSVCVYGGGG